MSGTHPNVPSHTPQPNASCHLITTFRIRALHIVKKSYCNKIIYNGEQKSLEVIFQKRVRVFHRGFKHEKTDESTIEAAGRVLLLSSSV